ncbi:ribonuclease HIII [uncultured Acidaminococcus sp.]|jgi:ribonuclease HIII|uniref:ribonuclease HIII n=1 Tax=Acidaminococcus sp. TaxID=1872103 RepID=UPI0025DC72B8|nr:ribonuclease HIII [uncultured Acidaminococcus sp.]
MKSKKLPESVFLERIHALQKNLGALASQPVELKNVNFGIQLVVIKGKERAVVTIYNGKDGWRPVLAQKEGPFFDRVRAVVFGTDAASSPQFGKKGAEPLLTLLGAVKRPDELWAGSDESGKGDYLGPLCVAAVVLDEIGAKKLLALGVRDSKTLSGAKIRMLAPQVYAIAKASAAAALMPQQYNEEYEKVRNLNPLLSTYHIGAIMTVIKKVPACHFALVDQFTRSPYIKNELERAVPGLSVYSHTKGEADMAVAAASILARSLFLKKMDELSQEAGFELPFGGGAQATRAAEKIIQQEGRERLGHYAKLHFANTKDFKE